MYRATTKGLIEGLISGYNATVFAYGPTGVYPLTHTPSHTLVQTHSTYEKHEPEHRRKTYSLVKSSACRLWEDIHHVGDGQGTGHLRANAQRPVSCHRGDQRRHAVQRFHVLPGGQSAGKRTERAELQLFSTEAFIVDVRRARIHPAEMLLCIKH